MVPETGLEPVRSFGTRDFKSLASTNSATPAYYIVCCKKMFLHSSMGNSTASRIAFTISHNLDLPSLLFAFRSIVLRQSLTVFLLLGSSPCILLSPIIRARHNPL